MPVDDRGAHQPAGDEYELEREHDRDDQQERDEGDAVVRRIQGGRHRRGRASASRGGGHVASVATAEVEPLVSAESAERILESVLDPIVDVAAVEAEAETERERERRYVTISSGDDLAPTFDPSLVEPRAGMFGSFRRWWRNESLARAAQKRAFATAEAIVRAQAVQDATQPLEKGPSPETYAQAVRGVLTLTEERFQSLGLRSDRVQDELRAISRTMTELHAILIAGGLEGVGAAASTAIVTLEERFESLLVALSDELRRRGEETDRRLAEQLTMQSADLATMLESAVERIRSAIPEGFETVRAAIPREMELVHEMVPKELDRLRDGIAASMPDAIRASVPDALEHLERAIPEQVGRLADENASMLAVLHEQMTEALERLHAMNESDLGEVSSSLRATTTRELERFRHVASEHLDRVRWAMPAEVDRARGASVEELVRIRGDIADLSRSMHEVIAGIAAITSATPGEGERAAPR
ncbi:MAG: hypothetical protein ACXWYI_07735 [Actinomycetota bacterium]